MITGVSTTPPEALSRAADQEATVVLMFARSMEKGDAIGVALTRLESLNLIMQLQTHLDATENDDSGEVQP